MMSCLRQLSLQLWKTILLQSRQFIYSGILLGWPFVLLAWVLLQPRFMSWVLLQPRFMSRPQFIDRIETRLKPDFEITNLVKNLILEPDSSLRVVMGFTPETNLAQKLMQRTRTYMNREIAASLFSEDGASPGEKYSIADVMNILNKTVVIKGFDTEDELSRFYKMTRGKKMHAVEFKNTEIPNMEFFIRTCIGHNFGCKPLPEYSTVIYPDVFDNNYRSTEYNEYGVLLLQWLVSKSIIEERSPTKNLKMTIRMKEIPHTSWQANPLVYAQNILNTIIVLAFQPILYIFVRTIAREKEQGLQEFCIMMGLNSKVYWTSWFIFCFLITLLTLITVALGLFIDTGSGPVLAKSSITLVGVCVITAAVSVCFAIVAVSQAVHSAPGIESMYSFLSIVLPFFIANWSYTIKWLSCLISPLALQLALRLICQYEIQGDGAQWSSFNTPPESDDFTLFYVWIMLLASIILSAIVAWYFSNICTGPLRVRRPCCFCLQDQIPANSTDAEKEIDVSQTDCNFAPEPTSLPVGIHIRYLRKDFGKTGTHVNISQLKMYKGETFVLLGHKGAGKTATISIITGLFKPTSGTVYLNGQDIQTNLSEVRKKLGLCPQTNICFDTLTVQEHLSYFAKIKGVASDHVAQNVEHMIEEVGLAQKSNALAGSLSVGQKRKLSFAIAFIGGPKIVILDEPTTGVDVTSRQQLWGVLKRQSPGRTLLLTTQYMDEADAVGDRICIMSKSKVVCCGPPLFLKKLYGTGYHLTIAKGSKCKASTVTQFIQDIIPTAELEAEVKLELTYKLPDIESGSFPHLLRSIEQSRQQLGITSYGISATSMEEVFLKIGKDAQETSEHQQNNNSTVLITNESNSPVEAAAITETSDNPPSEISKVPTDASGSDYTSSVDPAASSLNTPASSQDEQVNKEPVFFRYQKLTGWALLQSTAAGFIYKKTCMLRLLLVGQVMFVGFGFFFIWIIAKKAHKISYDEMIFNLKGYSADLEIPFSYSPRNDENMIDLGSIYKEQFAQPTHLKPELNVFFEDEINRIGNLKMKYRYAIGAEFKKENISTISAVAWYNKLVGHSQAVSLRYIISAFAQLHDNKSVSIVPGIHPLGSVLSGKADMLEHAQIVRNSTRIVGWSAGFPVFYLIYERVKGFKHLQMIAGVSPLLFWTCNLIFDFTLAFLGSLTLLPYLYFMDFGYLFGNEWGVMTLALALSSCAILNQFCVIHFIFTNPDIGVNVIFFGNMVIEKFLTIVWPNVFMFKHSTAHWILNSMLPYFCIIFLTGNMVDRYHLSSICDSLNYTQTCLEESLFCCKNYGKGCPEVSGDEFDRCFDPTESVLSWHYPGVGPYLLIMFLQGVVFFALTVFMEYQPFQHLFALFCCRASVQDLPRADEDSDVAWERDHINSSPQSQLAPENALLLANLVKRYGDLVAVDNICVGIQKGECFGLLGQNGAGKSTIFKMMTEQENMTSGDIYLNGVSNKKKWFKIPTNVGYCPQIDALEEFLTCKETLKMFARFHGVPYSDEHAYVKSYLRKFRLKHQRSTLFDDLSGGNKRKLSLAVALMGDPDIVLLDEPSSGVDPEGRREMWDVLSAVRASGKTLVLASHSMEECEALCTRLTIMMNGHMMCLGSPQHLKSKFTQGYELVIKMAKLSDTDSLAPVEPVVKRVQSRMPSAFVFYTMAGYAKIQVPDEYVKLADLFELLEDCKQDLHMEDYSVQQTSLEQVFLKITQEQA